MSLSKARDRGGELAICDVGKDLDFLRGRRNALVFSWRWCPFVFGTMSAALKQKIRLFSFAWTSVKGN